MLGRIVRQAVDGYLIGRLTQLCADEARHARVWERTLLRLDLPSIRIFKSYQSFLLENIDPPGTVAEVLAFVHIVEVRARQQFEEEVSRPSLPHAARRTMAALIRDEQPHQDWIARWLAAHASAQPLLAGYRRVDEQVHTYLRPFEDRLWAIQDLGEELTDGDTDDRSTHSSAASRQPS